MDESIEYYRKAGKLAKKALLYGAGMIKPGVSMREVLDKVEEFILKNGGQMAFPAQSCVNDVAAHYCPTEQEDYIYKEGDLVKIDVGVHFNGYVGDNAVTVSLNSEYEDLSNTTKQALENVTKILKPGITLDEIGRTVQETLQAKGYEPIRNLTGHGLAKFTLHSPPSVPNFPNGDETELEEGMVIAIEPFGTTGEGMIYNGSNPTIFALTKDTPVRSPHARQTLEIIKTFQGLPFTTRWLTKKLGGKALLGLAELKRAGILHAYPQLPEKAGGVVSQWENTFLITKDGYEVLTKDS